MGVANNVNWTVSSQTLARLLVSWWILSNKNLSLWLRELGLGPRQRGMLSADSKEFGWVYECSHVAPPLRQLSVLCERQGFAALISSCIVWSCGAFRKGYILNAENILPCQWRGHVNDWQCYKVFVGTCSTWSYSGSRAWIVILVLEAILSCLVE